MKTFRALAVLGGLAAGICAGGQAMAADCAGVSTISQFDAAPCEVVIKGSTLQLDLISTSNLPAGVAVAIVASPAGLSVNIIPVAPFFPGTALTGAISYSISVLSGPQVLDNVSLSSAVGLQEQVVVHKGFLNEAGGSFGPLLTNINGIESQANVDFPDFFIVVDDFTIQAGSLLSVFANNFGVVPEPATMALLGTGLLGLGLARRRRQAAT